MKKADAYKELTHKLKESDIKFHRKEEVREKIFSKLSSESVTKKVYLTRFYSWTEVRWLRWSVSTAALVFITIFLSQQLVISKRLSNLEGQLIKTETNVQAGPKSIPSYHRVILNLLSDRKFDSITVSKEDLEALFKEYLNLQEENEVLKNNSDLKNPYDTPEVVQGSTKTIKNL